ncbi:MULTISPECIES: hypothetical protein [Bacillus cereus group]|uniref:hypothetical protein n=1 Tax=Bacillus cereus group TaxID=86661 RepID=UPI0008FDC7C6|nr:MULTISPECIES: hypothetical protein [Bacillus cereus group]MBL3844637.1 hypothetical protein [Bacillus cereus]AXO94323.1 hypothetical protein DY471_18760 [Bacillus anthracis]MCU9945730.1 hypothetical protein [Bacillus pacificus]MCW4578401.1 hypothetical protein [Bacillus pacificus]OJD83384.1 hypothetical protein MCCC1A01412_26900 [Bacillus anthracis]
MIPSVAGHTDQYNKNKNFLNHLSTSKEPEHNWIITVAFYTALHLVEKELKNKGLSATNHVNRNTLIGKQLKNIRKEYINLYRKSRESRYDCFIFKQVDSDWAINQLNIIESKLSS